MNRLVGPADPMGEVLREEAYQRRKYLIRTAALAFVALVALVMLPFQSPLGLGFCLTLTAVIILTATVAARVVAFREQERRS
jgi:hypothetical protein